jgi:hypothetical protein
MLAANGGCMRWYINRTGTAEGPLDEPTIVGMIQRGELSSAHMICPEGGQSWQPLPSHPPFAHASSAPSAQVHAAADQVASGVTDAANAFAGAVNAPGSSAALSAPSGAAPGEGFFERAKAEGQPPSDAAKAGAGMAHLLAAGGAVIGCWLCGLGGVAGAFVGSVMYKEQPKSSFALVHMNQALVFQGVCWAANLVLAIVFTGLRIVGGMIFDLLGTALSLLHLVNLAIFAAAVILPFLQSQKAKAGEWSEYPKIGAKVLGLKSPILK